MADSAEGAMAPSSVYINGYLHKQTRDGRWQKRWFETNGSFLTYYKTKKMENLLAGVNLEQVGDIVMISRDHPADERKSGCMFSIVLTDRDYLLKAAKPEDAQTWVGTLNELKVSTKGDAKKVTVTPSNGLASSDSLSAPGAIASSPVKAPLATKAQSQEGAPLRVSDAMSDAMSEAGQAEPGTMAKARRGCCGCGI